MPLSTIQADVLRLIAANRSPDSYVAGATVLHRAEDTPRYSADLDLFHDLEDSVARSAETDAATLKGAGFELSWLLRTPAFHRAVVRREERALRLEWAQDSAFRFYPVQDDERFIAAQGRGIMTQESGVPAMAVSGRVMTAEELFALPDDSRRYALVGGELERMTPAGFDHGAILVNLTVPLGHHVKARRLGVVCGAETGFILARNPDTVLTPDIAFVHRGRIPETGRPASFWDGAPDLAVEVTSPGDPRSEVAGKVAAWLSAGTRVVWIVDPKDASVTIHEPGRATRRLAESDTLDGAPLLPGFSLAVREIFAP